MPASVTLTDLVDRGSGDIAHYRRRARPPASPLEWLGIAVAHLPELTASAHTADDVAPRTRPTYAGIREQLLAALARELGSAAATIHQARAQLLERHPHCDQGDTPEDYSILLEAAQRSAPRRSEMMIGGYASFLGGAIEVAGGLADVELEQLRGRRWGHTDHDGIVAIRAEQLYSALTNALGGLLAYARLLDEDAGHSGR